MRGIVELEVLKAIETELPVNVSVTSFFDLIVGTRFVHNTFCPSFKKCYKNCFAAYPMTANAVLGNYRSVFVVRY